MAYKPQNSNGQATMANSEPVAIASDQTSIPTKVFDNAGNAIGSELGADGLYHSLASIMQNIIVHAGSSSTANLAAGATFTGTSLSNIGVNAVQVNFRSDQNCTVQLQQSPDGTNWDYVNSFTVTANVAEWKTFNAAGSFCRVLVTNNSGVATTSLRLQTVLVPQMDVLPNSLTQAGNLKIAIIELKPSDLCVTATAAQNAICTLTIPAAGAGLFHYITRIEIDLFNGVARTGTGTPVIATSTNLPGSPSWNFPSAGTIGTMDRLPPLDLSSSPLKSSVANTATTIVGPATTSVIWKIKVWYYIGI